MAVVRQYFYFVTWVVSDRYKMITAVVLRVPQFHLKSATVSQFNFESATVPRVPHCSATSATL